MTPETEAELLARCRQGEPQAWDQLFDAHYAATARFVFHLELRFTREDVEDICQEVFLSVVQRLGTFNGRSRFQTWLFRIAVNKARDYQERQSAAKRGGGRAPASLQAPDPHTGLTPDAPSAAPGPAARLAQAEDAVLVTEALARVGRPCRELVELRYFGELSYEEIGAALRLNPKTVSSRLSRCLDRLETIVSQGRPRRSDALSPSNR